MIKKVELHVHLEGTILPLLARKLASRHRIKLPENIITSQGESYVTDNFLHFLQVYDQVAEVIRSPQDYYDLTFDYLHSSALDGVIYVEMMYSPDHAEKVSGVPSKEHLMAIQQAVNDAESQFGIIGRILITVVRQFGQEAAERIAKGLAHDRVPCVVGFGMGGDELGFPPQLFEKAYHIASKDAALPCTAHAGEFGSAESMLVALKHLPLRRIGHGVAAIHSPQVMNILKERSISLELCPSSNIKFGVYPHITQHPIHRFLEAGISISINSDDGPFIPTTVAKEYALVQKTFQYSLQQMNAITAMAINDAFVEESVKTHLRSKLNEV